MYWSSIEFGAISIGKEEKYVAIGSALLSSLEMKNMELKEYTTLYEDTAFELNEFLDTRRNVVVCFDDFETALKDIR